MRVLTVICVAVFSSGHEVFGFLMRNAGKCQPTMDTPVNTVSLSSGPSSDRGQSSILLMRPTSRRRTNVSLYSKRYSPKHRRKKYSIKDARKRYEYLYKASMTLLDEDIYPPGSLIKGKWHELHSMMMAWSKLLVSSPSTFTISACQDKNSPPIMIETILKRLIDERDAGNDNVEINCYMYNLAIEAWAHVAASGNSLRRSDHKIRNQASLSNIYSKAAQRSLDIVTKMQNMYDSDKQSNVKPNSYSFITALGAWAKATSSLSSSTQKSSKDAYEAAITTHNILRWMQDLSETGKNPSATPTVLAYSLVMDAYAKNGAEDSGVKAEALLRYMKKTAKLNPNTYCYNLVINAYTRQKRRDGAVRSAERILNELIDTYNKTQDDSLKPDVISYTSLVSAWANSNRKGFGARKAEEVLRQMESGDICKPNTVSYNAVLKAWSRSGEGREAARNSISLFQRMEQMHANGNQYCKPDRTTFNTLIHTLTKSGATECLLMAEGILQRMESFEADMKYDWAPNLFSYNACIEGWSKSTDRDSALNAWNILHRLLNRNGADIQPDHYSFNNVIFALSKSPQKDSAKRAEEVLRYMIEAHDSNSRNSIRPDVFGYSSVIHAWSRSGDPEAGFHAEKLLHEMEERYASGQKELKPNTVTFNAVIDCWAKSGQGTLAARKAEHLLQVMETMYAKGDQTVKPSAHTYNSVLQTWARSNTRCAHRKSQTLLNHMWRQYECGNEDVKPDSHAYNIVINAVSKSHRIDKAQEALRLLRQMDKQYREGLNTAAQPNTLTYTSVLNSCAYVGNEGDTRIKEKALDTAIFTLEELQGSSYGTPNHVTYGMFLKACANLIPSDEERRRVVVEPVFLQCCKDGQVGEMVLDHLRLAAPTDLYNKLLGVKNSSTKVRIEDLPAEWRCNVKNEKWRNRYEYNPKKKRIRVQ